MRPAGFLLIAALGLLALNAVWGGRAEPLPAEPAQTLPAAAAPENLVLSARAFISMAVGTDGRARILAERNATQTLPIASITKLFTAIAALREYDPETDITIPAETLNRKGSAQRFRAGETFRLGDLLYPLLIASDNDSARVLASKIGEGEFVGRMNTLAAELNLQHTHFSNPTGLDPDAREKPNHSTARDLAAFARELWKHPTISPITRFREYTLRTASGEIHHAATSTNVLLGEQLPFEIVTGKTGETPLAKKNLLLVTDGPAGVRYLIHVILSSDDNFGDTRKLVEWVSQNYK